MNGPSYVLESPSTSAAIPEVRNHTLFPSQYFQMIDADDNIYHVMVTRVTYDLKKRNTNGFPVISNKQVPLVKADQFYGDANKSSIIQESDFSPYKPHCDIIFSNATAYSKNGAPASRWPIAIKIGRWEKYLMVCGPRRIKPGVLGWKLDDPEPALEVALQYENSFGGTCQWPDILKNDEEAEILERYSSNPIGCGFLDKKWAKKSEPKFIKAPQVEVFNQAFDEQHLNAQNYPAVGLGCIGRWWQPRFKLAGTYDDEWKKHRWPALPKDFDFGYWNCAPHDQQIPYPQGGEEVHFVGLTKNDNSFKSKIPNNHPYSLVTLNAGPVLKRPMHLDTLIFDMQSMTLTCVHRTNVAANAGIQMIEVVHSMGN